MKGPNTSTLENEQAAERAEALRYLLRRPLVTARDDRDMFATIVRHSLWLKDWFLEQTGWNLQVDSRAEYARLAKVAARLSPYQPARTRTRTPFDRRRYTLLCLTLAALEDTPVQTTLARLAERVAERSSDEPDIPGFNPEKFSERRAFVDVLRWLEDTGALTVRDGDVDRYVTDTRVDALYDVDERLMRQLIAAPVPPSLAGTPDGIRQEWYAETPEGERMQARHTTFRLLLDEPVVYYEDLSEPGYAWLHHSRGFVYQKLSRDAGLRVERRREGLAAIDPKGQVTDELFPDAGSTVKHAALLLGEDLTGRARDHPALFFSPEEIRQKLAALMQRFGKRCGWSKRYIDNASGIRLLSADALDLLERFGLVRRTGEGIRPLAALARFAPAPSAQEDLFGGEL